MCKDKKTVNSEGTPCTPPPLPPPTALPIFSSQSIIYPSPPPRHGRHAIAYTGSLIHKNGGRHTHTHTNTHFPKGEIGKHFTPVVDYIDKKHKAVPSFIKNTREQASEIFTFSKDEGGRTEIRGESQRFLKIHSDKSTKRYLSSNLLNSQPHQIIRIKRQSQVPLYYSTLLTGHLRTECECVHAFLLKETFKPKNMKN